ncbi:MAG: DNA polymerase III subunit beta [Candidatus Nomurabacteria bacterium]|jgi:DNA polymerase-3 subunit beta|nr:DNA polymerase III subunit beta [Candidatus Nomurabacteria bacterium]
MKVVLTQEKLAKSLATVGRIVTSKISLPVLSSVMMRTDNGHLVLSTTNLEVAITESISAKIEKEGAVTVPVKLLTDFVSNLPKTDVMIEVTDNKMSIEAGTYKSVINTTNIEDFPEIPEMTPKNKLSIPVEFFKKSVAGTALAVSSDMTRPILTGVYVYSQDGELCFVATDGFRLAEKKVMKCDDEIAAIVPASTLNDVVRILNDGISEVNIGFSDDQINFKLGDILITSRLISGKFINYKQLIPEKTEISAVINRGEFVRTTKISEIFARESAGSIVIEVDSKKSTVNVRSIASQIGENSGEIEATVSGDGTITLNSKFLLDALNQIDGEDIKIQFSGKMAPILLTSDKNDDYKHIIMPVKS